MLLVLLLHHVLFFDSLKVWEFNPSYTVSSVALFKYMYWHYIKKSYWQSPKGYISPICGAPSNLNVTKFCMWVPFPDVIICARFYLYRPNSFFGGGPPKIGCSH